MTFSLHQVGVVISSQITHTQRFNIHRLAHILPSFSVVCPFHSLPQPHHVATHPCPGDNPSEGGPKDRGCVLHMQQGSPLLPIFRALSFSLHRHPFDAEGMTVTPSIQPNLGLPCTCSPLTSVINTFLAIRYSSIL